MRYWPIWKKLLFSFALACMLVIGGLKWLSWKMWDTTDLGHKPPDEVFTKIFKMPVPSGVFNLKISGYSLLSGYVYMKFSASNVKTVVSALRNNSLYLIEGPFPEPSGNFPPNPYSTHNQNDKSLLEREHMKATGWKDVFYLRKGEYYTFQPKPPNGGWVGSIVVDRHKKVVYVYGSLL